VDTTPEAGSLGDLPANVRVAPFVPHAELLPHVDAMVTNAGYNGVLTALARMADPERLRAPRPVRRSRGRVVKLVGAPADATAR
jgi:hypothetical protein